MDETHKTIKLSHFLADTWWFVMTKRLSDSDFFELVKIREKQGFTAAQIVVGIPPEVGIQNENAKSIFGSAWDEKGNINMAYLAFAKKRIKIMNEHHLTAIIYGAWGHQIEWIGTDRMINWWKVLIETFDDCDVIYCLTGEIDIWTNPILSKCLLPDKTTQNISLKKYLAKNILIKVYTKLSHNNDIFRKKRLVKWEKVLTTIRNSTDKPILIHTLPTSSGFSVIHDIELISANTFQTGHTRESFNILWRKIYESKKNYPNKPVINLEPYYEGIHNDFFGEWQLHAFWCSIASGSYSVCYGAHGIWNVGDGEFLSQWGKQTFKEALSIKTPEVLGKTYKLLLNYGVLDWEDISVIRGINDEVLSITRMSKDGQKIIYIPDITKCKAIPNGRYFIIESGEFISQLPNKGSIVVFD